MIPKFSGWASSRRTSTPPTLDMIEEWAAVGRALRGRAHAEERMATASTSIRSARADDDDEISTSPCPKAGRVKTSKGWYRRTIRALEIRATRAGEQLHQRLPLSPAHVEMISVVLVALTAITIFSFANDGRWPLAPAVLLLLTGAFESVDAVAAIKSRNSRRDVFVNYLGDRISDIVLFGSLAFAFVGRDVAVSALSVVVLVLALLSSYSRAQAEALRFSSRSDFGRLERLTCLFVGLASMGTMSVAGLESDAGLILGLCAGVAFTVVTLVQRVFKVLATPSYTEISVPGSWDRESFLPVLIDDLVKLDGRPVEIVVQSPPLREGRHQPPEADMRVVVEPQHDGHTRLRIIDRAS